MPNPHPTGDARSAKGSAPPADTVRSAPRDRRNLARFAFAASSVVDGEHSGEAPGVAAIGSPARPQFADYEMFEVIGEGGMGLVYRARQISLDREVALKLLSAGPLASARFVERFQSEARNAARLQHPNIVAIYEFGAHEDLNYIAMRLVRGRSLAEELAERGPWPPRNAAVLLRTIAEALDFAHRLGVLHLDLKPANVLLDENGEPLVADFGLARRLEEAIHAGAGEEISGTPNYMAPEQAVPGTYPLGAATDIHGLGAILYELLVGHPPFIGGTRRETLRLVVEETPAAPCRLREKVPRDLDAVCMKCLQKDPAARYASARELADDLGRFLEQRPVHARPLNVVQRGWRWARREPRVAALLVLLFAALAGGLVATNRQREVAEANGARAELNAGELRRRLWASRLDDAWQSLQRAGPSAALRPVVANLAEQEQAGDTPAAERSRARIAALLSQGPQLVDAIATGDLIYAIALDPDGHWVASLDATAHVRRFDVATGRQRWRTTYEPAQGVIALADALRTTTRGDALVTWVIDAPESVDTPIPESHGELLIDSSDGHVWVPPRDRFRGLMTQTYSPDGDSVLVVSRPTEAGPPRMQLLHSRDWHPISPARDIEPGPVAVLVSPGGRHVAHVDTKSNRLDLLDGATLRSRFSMDNAGHRRLVAWRYAHSGRQLALAHFDGSVETIDLEDGKSRTFAPSGGNVRLLEFSDDDAWLAATFIDGTVRIWDTSTGQPVGDPISMPQQSTEHEYGQLDMLVPDPATRSVFVADWLDAIAWPVPFDARGGEPLLHRPPQARRVSPVATAYRPALGLLAAGAQDGEIRIWRSRSNTPARWRGPLQFALHDEPAYDGQHMLRVAGTRLQVIDVHSQQPVSVEFALDQAAGFAELVAGTPWLVATSGRVLHRFDWRAGRELEPAVELEATPAEIVLAARTVLVRANAFADGANLERLEAYSIETGKRLGAAEFPGWIESLQVDPDGRTVTTVNGGRVQQFAAETLKQTASLVPGAIGGTDVWRAQEDGGPSVSAMPGRSSRTLWLSRSFTDPVLSLDVASGTLNGKWSIGDVRVLLPLGDGARAVVLAFGSASAPILTSSGIVTSVPAPRTIGVGALAQSADATRFAMARTHGFVVFDSQTGEWLTPPIDFQLDPRDSVVGLVLDAHGTEVVARTQERRWLPQSLASERRPAMEVQALADLQSPVQGEMNRALAPALDPALRTALRAADPGAPHAPPPADEDVPESEHSYAENLVDLRPICSRSAKTWDMPMVPPGLQRMLGVDFIVRCGIVAPSGTIPVGMRSVAALDLLMGAWMWAPGVEPYAYLNLHYRDGSGARLTINYRDDVLATWVSRETTKARRAYTAPVGNLEAGIFLNASHQLFAVRLANPHPERKLDGLEFLATGSPWSQPVLIGLTLEPQTIAAPATPGSER